MDRETRMYDNFDKPQKRTVKEILTIVYDALDERGTLCVVGAQQALDACADEHLTIDNL